MAHGTNGIRIGNTQAGLVGMPGSLPRIALVLLVVGGTTISDLSMHGIMRGWAQTAVANFMANFLSGQVTANQGNDIQINNKNYPLQQGVTIIDDEGKPRDLKDLPPGAEVKFHLKNGQIDQIVLILPK